MKEWGENIGQKVIWLHDLVSGLRINLHLHPERANAPIAMRKHGQGIAMLKQRGDNPHEIEGHENMCHYGCKMVITYI